MIPRRRGRVADVRNVRRERRRHLREDHSILREVLSGVVFHSREDVRSTLGEGDVAGGRVETHVHRLRAESLDERRDVRLLELDVEREVHHLSQPEDESAIAVRASGGGGRLAAPEGEQDVHLLPRLGEVETLVKEERTRIVVPAQRAVDEHLLLAVAGTGSHERREHRGRGRCRHPSLPLRPSLVLISALARVLVRANETHLEPLRLLRGHHETSNELIGRVEHGRVPEVRHQKIVNRRVIRGVAPDELSQRALFSEHVAPDFVVHRLERRQRHAATEPERDDTARGDAADEIEELVDGSPRGALERAKLPDEREALDPSALEREQTQSPFGRLGRVARERHHRRAGRQRHG